MPHKYSGVFITGTDTGAGKTFFGLHLAAYCYHKGIPVQPRKPIESGCTIESNYLIPADGLAYHEATNKTVSLDIITPYRLKHALSPGRAAQLENRRISIEDLYKATTHHLDSRDYVIVEGAGGFHSPLAYNGANHALASLLQLPVVIIAPNRLGCINHIMLTLEAIDKRKLTVVAIILNQTTAVPDLSTPYNAEDISHLSEIPVLEVAYQSSTSIDDICRTVYTLTAQA